MGSSDYRLKQVSDTDKPIRETSGQLTTLNISAILFQDEMTESKTGSTSGMSNSRHALPRNPKPRKFQRKNLSSFKRRF
jgi:hypothetical protein